MSGITVKYRASFRTARRSSENGDEPASCPEQRTPEDQPPGPCRAARLLALAHHVERGDRVTLVGVLQGVRVHDKVVSDELRFTGGGYAEDEADELKKSRNEVKYEEVREACRILGIEDVRFLGIEECSPCYWMNQAFGPGTEEKLKGRGGLRARILSDGLLRVGNGNRGGAS